MTREPPDVANEAGLRKLVERGWHLVVVSYGDAELRGKVWTGDWGVRIATPDGVSECMLVLSRPPNDERRFQTLGTVVSLLVKYDVAVVQVPMRGGARAVNVPMRRWKPS